MTWETIAEEMIAECLDDWTAKDLEREFPHPRRGALTR
jgi:hypothetical protein